MSVLNASLYVPGDLNIDQLSSNKPTKTRTNNFKSLLKRLNLQQLVTEPTRITNESKTLLDLIITNDKQSIIDVTVRPSIADHHEIGCLVNIRKTKQKVFFITCRSKSSYSKELLQNELFLNIPLLNTIFNTDDVTTQVNIFTTTFIKSLDKISPLRTTKINRPPVKWMTSAIKKEIKLKNNLSLRSKFDPNQFQLYKEQRTKVRKLISKAKAKCYHAELKEAYSNPKETWNIIQRIVPYQIKQRPPLFDNSESTADDFNKYFASVGETVYKEVMQTAAQSPTLPHLNIEHSISKRHTKHWSPEPTTAESIISVIYSLKNTKSTGADNITLHHIKDSLRITLPFILNIINTSIVTNSFPSQWKHAEISLIHKSGDLSKPSNFRPISLLPILSKILEKELANQLLDYLESNDLLN